MGIVSMDIWGAWRQYGGVGVGRACFLRKVQAMLSHGLGRPRACDFLSYRDGRQYVGIAGACPG